MVGERVKKWGEGLSKYIEDRIEIAKWSASQIEDSIRTGETVLLELDIPPNPSAEFGEERRRRVRKARYKLLKNFEPFRKFTERRIIKNR